jgi:hypothetical protein
VRRRWLLGRLRAGLPWALAGDVLVAAGGRLLGYSGWPLALVAWTALALVAAVALALRRWPNDWAVAVAADGLGLAERVTSAIHAARVGHPAAGLLAADVARVLPGMNPAGYSLLPDRHIHRLEAAALLCLALAVLLPIPVLGDGGRRAAGLASRRYRPASRATRAGAGVTHS